MKVDAQIYLTTFCHTMDHRIPQMEAVEETDKTQTDLLTYCRTMDPRIPPMSVDKFLTVLI